MTSYRADLAHLADWDRRLGRRWALALFAAWIMPLYGMPFGDQGSVLWPWETWEHVDGLGAWLVALAVPQLAVAVWIVLGMRSRRARGLAVFLACGVAITLPLVVERLRFAEGLEGLLRAEGMALVTAAFLLGSAFVAAGNRQTKREIRRGLPAVLAAAGGVLILAACFVPIYGFSVYGVVTSELANDAWPAAVWMLGFALYALLAVAGLLVRDPHSGPARVLQGFLSMLGRILPAAFVLLGILWPLAEGMTMELGSFIATLKQVFSLLPAAILPAIGLARFLEGDGPALEEPDADGRLTTAADPR